MSGNCTLGAADCCTEDFDCVGTLICIRKAEWTEKKDFCECSLWYGWEGPKCLWFGPASYFLLFAILLAAIILSNLLGHILYTYYRLIKKPVADSFDTLTTLVFTSAAAYLLLQWRIIELINLVEGRLHIQKEDTGDGLSQEGPAKMQYITMGSRVTVLMMGLFVCLATLNVPLIWVGECEFSEDFKTLTRQAIRLSQFIFLLAVIIISSVGRLEIVAGVALALLTVIGICFAIFRSKCNGILTEDIKWYINFTLVTLFLETVFCLVYTIYFVIGWKMYSPKGEVSSFVAYNEGMIFSIIFTCIGMFLQCRYSLKDANSSVSSESKVAVSTLST